MLPILWSNSNITIYSYPFFWGLGWGMSFFYIWKNIVDSKIIRKIFLTYFLLLFLVSWMGAKVLAFYSYGALVLLQHAPLDFWLNGGFVFYGGLLAGMLLTAIFYFFYSVEFKSILPFIVIALPLGQGIGRIGCFFTGCCYGLIINNQQIPIQLFEAVVLLGIFYYLHRKYGSVVIHSKSSVKQYFVISETILLISIERIMAEIWRADVRGSLMGVSTSTFISLLLLLLSFVFYLVSLRIARFRNFVK